MIRRKLIFSKKILRVESNMRLWIENNPVKMIIITGVFMRLLVAILYRHITIYPDSIGYIALAERIFDMNIGGYNGERSPGYPLLLIATGISYLFTVILQSLTGILSLILAYKIAVHTGISNRISLLLTLALACYIPTFFFEFAILTEALTLFIIMVIFYLYFSIISGRDKLFYNNLLIVFCGLLVLVKPFYVFLPVLLFTFLFFSNISAKKTITKHIHIALIPIVLFLGWSYVNKANTGYFTSTTLYGFNLAQTCVNFAANTTLEYTEIGNTYARYRDEVKSDKEIAMTIWEAEPELKEKTGLSFPDLSHKLYEYSLATIKKNPCGYLEQVLVSWSDFWKTSLYWEYESVTVPYANNIILYVCYIERIILQLIKILFVLLIPYNIAITFRNRKLSPPFVISAIVLTASVLQALVTYGTNSRFSFPFETLIVLSVAINIAAYRKKRLELSK